MKPQPLKLAGILALMFGGVTSFGAGAIEQDSPTVTVGSVMMPGDALATPVPLQEAGGAALKDAASSEDGIVAGDAQPERTVEPRNGIAPGNDQAGLVMEPVSSALPDTVADTVAPRTEDAKTAALDPDAANSDPDWPPAGTVALTSEQLDNMRGGFDLPSGLKVSFGIERVAFVNGNMVSTTNINIPDVSAITAQQAQALAAASTSALVQVGSGNTVQQGALPGLTGAVIQNTLNNQQIQALTTINTTVNSLGTFKTMNVGSTINGALINAVRPR